MSPQFLMLFIAFIILAIAFLIAMANQRKTQSAFTAAVELGIERRRKMNAVIEAQSLRKRVTSPQDMKRANLALDRAIEELV